VKDDVQDGLPMDQQIGDFSVMKHGGGHQAQAGVMFIVVPTKESLTKPTPVQSLYVNGAFWDF